MLKTKSVQTGTAKSNGAGRRGAHALMRVAFQGDRGAYAESAIARICDIPSSRFRFLPSLALFAL